MLFRCIDTHFKGTQKFPNISLFSFKTLKTFPLTRLSKLQSNTNNSQHLNQVKQAEILGLSSTLLPYEQKIHIRLSVVNESDED